MYAIVGETTNYYGKTTATKAFTISQRTVSITAPTYNGSTLIYEPNDSKTIASGGSCTDGGTFYYYMSTSNSTPTFNTSTWSTSEPTAIYAGTYYVWYYAYVSDTTNNTGTGINTVKAISGSKSIDRASINPTVSMSGYTYAGTKQTPSISENPGSGTVTYYYNSSDSNSGGSAWSGVSSSTSLNAGTYYMYAVVAQTANYYGATTATKKFIISKATPTLSITLATGLVYNLGDQSLVTAASVTGGGTIYTGVGSSSSSSPSSWNTWTTSCKGKAAGTYYVWAKADESTNYIAVSATYKGSVTIATKTASVTSYPSAKSTEYSGSSITLISGGSATGATFTYSTSESGTYSTTIPSGTVVADTKTIYWKLTANTNYNTTGLTTSGSCKGTIYEKTISIPTPTSASGTYDGTTTFKASFGSATGASITNYRYSTDNSSWTQTGNTTNPGQKNAGTLYVQAYYTASTNYTGSGWSSSATIKVAKAESTLPTTWSGAAVYYHSTASLTYSGQAGGTIKFRYDENNGTSWTETNTAPTRSKVGDTAVQCMIVGDSNHNDSSWSSTVTLTVYKSTDATMTVNLASELTYNTTGQTLATGSDLHGVSTYYLGYSSSDVASDSSVTWGNANSSISATNAGTYYIYYKFSPDSTHSNSKSCTKVGSVVIGKANGTITYSASSPSETIYCTTAATTATKLVAAKTITISTGATGATGAISYSVDLTGWSTTGLELTIPINTVAGTYTPTITATSAETSNYKEKTASQKITVTITAQTLNSISMNLPTSVNYGSSVTPSTTAKYTSGATETVTATYTEDTTVTGYPHVEITND